MDKNLLFMGVLGRAHGIKGEIGVNWHGDYVAGKGTPIFLRLKDGQLRKYSVTGARMHKGRPLWTLSDINDRTQAEALSGAEIFISRAVLPSLADDETYLEDLINAEISLPDGQLLGKLDHLEFPAGQEVWAIRMQDGKEALFPAREEFIVNIDTDSGKIVIDPPPGLLDVYRA